MMTSRKVFEKLYNGDFNAFERKVHRTAENKAIHQKISNELSYFKGYFEEKMSFDDAQRFEALENLYMESSSYEQEDAFAYGFKFATMLMSAVFADNM